MQDEIVTVVMKNQIHTSDTSTENRKTCWLVRMAKDGISQTLQKFWILSGTSWKNYRKFWKILSNFQTPLQPADADYFHTTYFILYLYYF